MPTEEHPVPPGHRCGRSQGPNTPAPHALPGSAGTSAQTCPSRPPLPCAGSRAATRSSSPPQTPQSRPRPPSFLRAAGAHAGAEAQGGLEEAVGECVSCRRAFESVPTHQQPQTHRKPRRANNKAARPLRSVERASAHRGRVPGSRKGWQRGWDEGPADTLAPHTGGPGPTLCAGLFADADAHRSRPHTWGCPAERDPPSPQATAHQGPSHTESGTLTFCGPDGFRHFTAHGPRALLWREEWGRTPRSCGAAVPEGSGPAGACAPGMPPTRCLCHVLFSFLNWLSQGNYFKPSDLTSLQDGCESCGFRGRVERAAASAAGTGGVCCFYVLKPAHLCLAWE